MATFRREFHGLFGFFRESPCPSKLQPPFRPAEPLAPGGRGLRTHRVEYRPPDYIASCMSGVAGSHYRTAEDSRTADSDGQRYLTTRPAWRSGHPLAPGARRG